jgi:hypothetical protein
VRWSSVRGTNCAGWTDDAAARTGSFSCNEAIAAYRVRHRAFENSPDGGRTWYTIFKAEHRLKRNAAPRLGHFRRRRESSLADIDAIIDRCCERSGGSRQPSTNEVSGARPKPKPRPLDPQPRLSDSLRNCEKRLRQLH